MGIGLLERQIEGLLAHIARDREQRLNELRSQMQSEVRTLLRAARHEARMSVRKAIAEARLWADEETRRAQAHAELEARRRLQLRTRAVLLEMWREIGGALEARWQDRAAQAVWIEAAIREAAALLGAREPWRIEHGPQGSQGLRTELEARARRLRPALRIEWQCDDRITAGVRIRAAGVCLDATIAGLLARREQIESDFLAHCLGAASAPAAPQARREDPAHG
jgi:vacuolar-type H+-ATPase subunit E/Vma4